MMKLMVFLIMLMLNIKFINVKILSIYNYLLLMILMVMMMMSNNFSVYWMNLYGWMGTDYISMSLVYLSIWILGMMLIISLKFNWGKVYNLNLLMLLVVLILSFISMNFFMFYIFFEISLIPTFLLIMGWGYQPERLNASMYMILYTLFASLPLLILVIYLFNILDSLNYEIILGLNLKSDFKFDFLFYFYMIFAFIVKLPLFIFHMWLPKAHIEAPVSGSMILAGVMLKLGGYGLMRVFMMMMNYSLKYNYLMMVVGLVGLLVLSLLCLRLTDMKLIVAYSSVVHMGMMLMGLMSMMIFGWNGGLLMMLAHGVCSSAMFMMVNYFYESSKTRNIFINKGLVYYSSSLLMWWFMFCIANMSAPISLNLLSELMIISILLNWSLKILLLLMLGMYFSACYSLYLFSYIFHGKLSSLLLKMNLNSKLNYVGLLMHWIPLNLLFLKVELFM